MITYCGAGGKERVRVASPGRPSSARQLQAVAGNYERAAAYRHF